MKDVTKVGNDVINASHETKKETTVKRIIRFTKWMFHHWKLTGVVLLLMALTVIGICFTNSHFADTPLVALEHNEKIEDTAEEIRSIRDIGQWEFLSISTEELVELHEPHTFGDTHLVKVFYGTLRLGVDMTKAKDDWFQADKGTAIVTLPDIALLDEDFIDEARTTTFYEKGTFGAKEKEKLYEKAATAMKKRTLTESNVVQARKHAEEQFTKLFHALGYQDVVVKFEEKQTIKQQDQQS